MIPATSRGPSGCSSPVISPVYPCRTPITSSRCVAPTRTTARRAAFMPGASPPLVSTAIRFMPPALHVPTLKSGPFEALPLRAVQCRAQASAWVHRAALLDPLSWTLPHEPSSGEPRPAQPAHDVRVVAHHAPHQSATIVLDHRDDRPLIDP